MDADTGRRLREADWADLGIRLTAYATWKARNYRWRTRQVWALAAGQTPEDVAREAIAKVLDGTRTWEPQRGPLLPFLQGIVDSLMSHLAASADNAIIERWHDAIPDAAAPEEPDDSEAAELINRLRGALEQHGGDDLLAVLGAVQEHGARPSAIAVALGTSVIDVNNRLKRLRRVALRLLHAAPARKRA
jgi:DNA-directed RNA polymerase specialized sigma24 family protein